ncbi:MAG: hypothetical protein ABIF77_18290 [bacterium]
MKRWLQDNPWIWIVLFFLAVFGVNMVMIVISILNKPVVLPHG